MATQIVTTIKVLTQRSQELQAPAQSISLLNGPLIIIGQGPFPHIIKALEGIVSTATAELAQMQSRPAVAEGSDANTIFDAYREVSTSRSHSSHSADSLAVRPSQPGVPQHHDWQSRIVQYSAGDWRTSRRRASQGRACVRREYNNDCEALVVRVH